MLERELARDKRKMKITICYISLSIQSRFHSDSTEVAVAAVTRPQAISEILSVSIGQ